MWGKTEFRNVKVIMSLPRFLIYFAVLDSAILLIAFASLVLSFIRIQYLLLYFAATLIVAFFLFEGGEK